MTPLPPPPEPSSVSTPRRSDKFFSAWTKLRASIHPGLHRFSSWLRSKWRIAQAKAVEAARKLPAASVLLSKIKSMGTPGRALVASGVIGALLLLVGNLSYKRGYTEAGRSREGALATERASLQQEIDNAVRKQVGEAVSAALAEERQRSSAVRQEDRAEAERRLNQALAAERENARKSIAAATPAPRWEPKVEIKPPSPPQTREEQCLACRATGKVSCSACKGTGLIPCEECEEDGYVTSGFFTKTRAPCEDCKATKLVKCTGIFSGCDGTQLMNCTKCLGRGRIRL